MSAEKIRLLHLDDSPAELKLMQVIVEMEGEFEYLAGLDSADTLAEEAARLRPDLILMDLRMGGQDPLVAMKDVLKLLPDVRVVAYTGFDDPELRDAVLDAGAWGFVRKSLDLPATLGAMAKAYRSGSEHFVE